MLIDDKPNPYKKRRQPTPSELNILHTTDGANSTFHRHRGFIVEVIPVSSGYMHAIHYGNQVFHRNDTISVSREEAIETATAAIDVEGPQFKAQCKKVGCFGWLGNRRVKAGHRAGKV